MQSEGSQMLLDLVNHGHDDAAATSPTSMAILTVDPRPARAHPAPEVQMQEVDLRVDCAAAITSHVRSPPRRCHHTDIMP
jgi:hypothetical protein